MRKLSTLIILVSLSLSSLSQNNTFKLGYTGAYPNNWDWNNTSNANWSWYNELNLNMWAGWWVGEKRLSVLSSLSSNSMDGLFQPDTILWAGLGRQLIIQAEETTGRFRYNTHNCGTQVTDNGRTVMFYEAGVNCNNWNFSSMGPITILANAEENGVQSFCAVPYDPANEIPFPWYDENGYGHYQTATNTYYIKPIMRISTDDAFVIPPLNVAKVIIKAYDGTPISQVVITTDLFRHDNGTTYDGRYLEDYWNLP
jgi:hypothetical protein